MTGRKPVTGRGKMQERQGCSESVLKTRVGTALGSRVGGDGEEEQ